MCRKEAFATSFADNTSKFFDPSQSYCPEKSAENGLFRRKTSANAGDCLQKWGAAQLLFKYTQEGQNNDKDLG